MSTSSQKPAVYLRNASEQPRLATRWHFPHEDDRGISACRRALLLEETAADPGTIPVQRALHDGRLPSALASVRRPCP